ncbi:MAG: SDR family NAD(P)-dependent oxidoreductase, partial [Bifidobacteriaceae bacterium]|nr:SDR family NAD(P)-dependent oxidoreductase [Bifidobacteriaceae bacterium]
EHAYDPAAEPIAIVGMAAVFPEAANLEEYWRNNLNGLDAITEVPPWRWNPELFYREDSTDTDFVPSKRGGFLQATEFDPGEFGIVPQSVPYVEPAQLLALMVARDALRDAGIDNPVTANLEETSVIIGTEPLGEVSNAYGARSALRSLFGGVPEELDEVLPRVTDDSFAGILANVTAGRIANRLNCGGRNFTVDAACASSLAALDLACQELWSDRANMVICGGVDLHNGITDFVMFAATHALSRRGRCAAFDQSGDGLALGEGAAMVILKRLSDAERDGDKIYSVVRAVHGSSDGRSLGLTVPNLNGQAKALKRAYQMADVLPSEVGLIEAHGTGTAVGDKTELAALSDVLTDAGALPGQTYLGSVKSLIGHTKCAAGLAGLVRAALAVHHAIIPPTLHLENPNSAYVEGLTPVCFNNSGRATPWNSPKRIAGISGFGFGGTNFHAVIQNYDPEPAGSRGASAWTHELFVFRGETLDEAKTLMGEVKDFAEASDRWTLKDLAFTLAEPSEAPIQATIVAGSWEELETKIDAVLDGALAPGAFVRDPKPGKVAFLFTGQGSQRVRMAADLFVLFPQTRALLQRHPAYAEILFPKGAFSEQARQARRDAVTDTRNAQVLLGLVDLAIADLLADFGIEADMAAGHSYGELPALAYAGVIDREDLPELSRRRAEAILGAVGQDPGKMVAVFLPPDQIDQLLKGREGLWAVNRNSPAQTVVGGASDAIDALAKELAGRAVRHRVLNVACAFHTPLLGGAEAAFAQALRSKVLGRAALPVWSNTTAAPYPAAADEVKQRLAEHLVKDVEFAAELRAMHHDGARVFIEAGPGGALTGLVKETLGEDVVAIRTESRPGAGLATFLGALGQYAASGRAVNLDKLFAGRNANRLPIKSPQSLAPSPTAWMIDGLGAVACEQWQAQGKQHIRRTPMYGKDSFGRLGSATQTEPPTPDQLVLTYLENIRALLDDQRDVVLGYLGASDARPAPRQPSQPELGYASAASDAPPAAPARRSAQAAPAAPAVPVPDESAAPELPRIPDLTAEQLNGIVFDVVSDKTGYPTSMLGLTMDIEEDLSIDSIKRLEIVGSLGDRMLIPALTGSDGNATGMLEALASIKTLEGVINWLRDSATDAPAHPAPAAAPPRPAAVRAHTPPAPAGAASGAGSPQVSRIVFHFEERGFGDGGKRDLAGLRFAVTDDEAGAADAIGRHLAERGAETVIVKDSATAGAEIHSCDGIVLLNVDAAPASRTVKDLFNLLKAADWPRLKLVAVFDDAEGALVAAHGPAELAAIQGFPGFIKTLHRECADKSFKHVGGLEPFDLTALPAQVVAELETAGRFPDIAYRGAQRLHRVPILAERAPGEAPSAPPLRPDSVVLVLGGAQGIVPEFVARLAKDAPVRFILAGRTERDAAEAARLAHLATRDEVLKHVIEVEHITQPREAGRRADRIMKARRIEDALGKIAQTGAQASYMSFDARDASALRAAIAQIKEQHGRVNAVIHAAGVIRDKLFQDKTWDVFEDVYSTKTGPLEPILAELSPGLDLLVFFSSMSGAFGNHGQADYAAGNSALGTVSDVLERRGDVGRVLCVEWGPFAGGGMVDSAIEAEMTRQGIRLIDMAAGADFLAAELAEGSVAQVIALGGGQADARVVIDKAIEDR